MNFKSIIKSLIIEARELLDQYDVDGQYVDILYNTHSNMATNSSKFGRLSVEDVKNSMEEILDVIIEVSSNILNKPSKLGGDRSILVVDNQIGADYHFWVNKSKSDVLFLTINTSISHPKHLPSEKNEGKIIITKLGDAIVKESVDETFTYKIKGDIIIYYKTI